MDEKYSQIKMDIGLPEENSSLKDKEEIKEEQTLKNASVPESVEFPEKEQMSITYGNEKEEYVKKDFSDLSDNESPKENKSGKKSSNASYPETVSISESIAENEEDENETLVSPNEKIFNLVTEKLKNVDAASETGLSDYTDDFKSDRKEKKEVKFDNTYASTSSTDMAFMRAFGIGNTMNTININDTIGRTTSEIDTMQGDIHSDYYEYTNRQQRKEIVGMYKYAKKSIMIKTVICAVFAVLLMLVENVSIFSNNIGGILDINTHPYLHFFMNFVFFILCAACAYEQLYHGARSIISKEYIPESVAVIAFAVGFIHSVIMLICIPFGYTPIIHNFPIAVILLMSLVFSYINVVREKYGFSTVSSKDVKFILRKDKESISEDEQSAFNESSEEAIGNIARVEECSFVKNYFANTNSGVKLGGYLSIYFKAIIIVPIVFAIIAAFRNSSLHQAVAIWNLGIVLALPVGVLFMYSVPFFIGNRRLFEDQTSIIGEEAINEYAETDIITVNDTTAFPYYNIKMHGLNLYNGYKMEKVLYYSASGFSAVGGPLAQLFDISIKDSTPKSKRVKFICSGRSYLCVKVDNDVIIFADKYGMMSQGIDLGEEKEEIGDCSAMYIACNTKLCARMYLKYKIDEEFLKIVNNLKKCSVGIKTFDPNINNELISEQTKLKKKDLRVIRLTSDTEIPTVKEKSDSSIVSKGLSKSLLKAVPVCKRIVKIRKIGKVLKVLASVLGMVFIGFVVFGGLKLIPSLAVFGYYCAVMLIMGALTLVLMPSRR